MQLTLHPDPAGGEEGHTGRPRDACTRRRDQVRPAWLWSFSKTSLGSQKLREASHLLFPPLGGSLSFFLFFKLIIFFFIFYFFFFDLATWHAGSSPTRDRTQVPCVGSTESYPLDRQGSPGGGSLPAHLGSPRSWGPASHQHRHTGWVGSRSPRRRRAYRPLEGSRLRSRPGPESSAIPTPWVPRGPRLCWIHWETEVLFGPETLRSKDRSWRCWGAGCTVGEEARGRLLGAESDSRHIRMGWEWGNRET